MNVYVIELSKSLSNIVKGLYWFSEVYLSQSQTSVMKFLCYFRVVKVSQKSSILDFQQSPRYPLLLRPYTLIFFIRADKLKTAANG